MDELCILVIELFNGPTQMYKYISRHYMLPTSYNATARHNPSQTMLEDSKINSPFSDTSKDHRSNLAQYGESHDKCEWDRF